MLEAVNKSGGNFEQTLFHGTGALLSASHPDVDFGVEVNAIIDVMQDAFAGVITFEQSKLIFIQWNSVEFTQGGCPLN